MVKGMDLMGLGGTVSYHTGRTVRYSTVQIPCR